ncbi:TetR/AcrR family transcriptional regulator [Boseongicola sp. H5]|uniref:TetR/AcrR family transcriptional regulator n=1 Tax=Rhodobacterales TaxID=204455 RepID=UPI001B0A81B6|nr:TetR/AcrR family transcriptional regulator [Boseongicola sp. H5]MBO6604611.1 TetR family transcriptional regulator [Roseicyclus sp.]MBO6626042.1 TetR family transcriptional regulator [Roseicyclus sp.]MBO6923432.1 TetR family transcriptional regulator [Roseicyclus sp.]
MPRGLARDHAEKRAALRKGAAKHFAEHGYDRASMASVASACGVSKALIYHYYDSKEALLFDILEGHLGALVKAVDRVPDTGAPEAQLRALIQAILTNYRDADAEHKLQIDALDTLPTDMKAPLIDLQRRLVTRMSDVIAAIGVSGELRAVTMTVFGMLNWFYMWHRPGKGISREAYGDLVTDMVLGGVRNL